MQQRTGSFKENFSKNTFYRFLNSSKTNWFRFTSILASQIINDEVKNWRMRSVWMYSLSTILFSTVPVVRKQNSVPKFLIMSKWNSGRDSVFWHLVGATAIRFFRSTAVCLHLLKKVTSLDRQNNSTSVLLQENVGNWPRWKHRMQWCTWLMLQ